MKMHRMAAQVIVVTPPYGSEGCECGTHATPYIDCPLHKALAVLEKADIDHLTIDTHEYRLSTTALHGTERDA